MGSLLLEPTELRFIIFKKSLPMEEKSIILAVIFPLASLLSKYIHPKRMLYKYTQIFFLPFFGDSAVVHRKRIH